VKKSTVAFSDAAIADILEQSDWYEGQADRSLAQRWEEAVTATLFAHSSTAGRNVRLLAESDAGEFFLEALALCGICGSGELVRQGEKSSLLSVFELKACFEQIDENAVGAGLVRSGHCAYALGDSGRDCHA
jgi:hypothetical protein